MHRGRKVTYSRVESFQKISHERPSQRLIECLLGNTLVKDGIVGKSPRSKTDFLRSLANTCQNTLTGSTRRNFFRCKRPDSDPNSDCARLFHLIFVCRLKESMRVVHSIWDRLHYWALMYVGVGGNSSHKILRSCCIAFHFVGDDLKPFGPEVVTLAFIS